MSCIPGTRVVLSTMAIAAAALAASAGCSNSPVDPTAIVGDLRISAELAPDVVAAGDSTTLSVTIENPTAEDVTLGFAMGCPYFLESHLVWAPDRSAGLDGTRYYCLAVISSVTIPARDEVVYHNVVGASRDGQPAAPGVYAVTVEWTGSLPDIEATFRIR